MEVPVLNSPLNAMQIHFLESLRFVKTEEMFQELKQIISDYFFKKMEEEVDRWSTANEITDEKLDEMFLNSHYRWSER